MRWIPLVLSSLGSLGCGETAREAILRVRPACDERRRDLVALSEWLPPQGLASEKTWLPERLDPPLVIGGTAEGTTAEVVMAEQLIDPDSSPARDFWIGPRFLVTCMQWTGPQNPMDPSVIDESANLAGRCDEALAYPYLIVLRTLKDQPEAVSVEVLLVRRRPVELLGAFRIDVAMKPGGGVRDGDPFRGAVRCALQSEIEAKLGVSFRGAAGMCCRYHDQLYGVTTTISPPPDPLTDI